MAPAEAFGERPRDPEPLQTPEPDVQLTPEDREDLLVALAAAAPNNLASQRLLRALGFPGGAIPAWTGGQSPEDWWAEIMTQLDAGRIPQPYRRLITRLANTYSSNAVIIRLFNTYVAQSRSVPEPAANPRSCHVIVRAPREEDRQHALAELNRLSLSPREALSTEHVISFSVASSDPETVRRALERTDLPWTLVPPNGPMYLFRELLIQRPDGTRVRAIDTPANTTVRELAEEVLTPEGAEPGDQVHPSAVIDRQRGDGGRDRLNPDSTLDDAGIEDGDTLQMAAEGRAGRVNPIERDDALARVRSQVLLFAANGRASVKANSLSLPTEYDIEFVQPSFGPPPDPAGEPVLIDRHRVNVQLVPGFPIEPPRAFWLTDIFHPNVFPNYPCDLADRNPEARGLVCLGKLAESWFPGVDFGEVCRVLIDIAGYRNYDIFEVTTDPDGERALRTNFYDPAAAAWAFGHQAEIRGIGGTPVFHRRIDPPRARRHVLYPMD